MAEHWADPPGAALSLVPQAELFHAKITDSSLVQMSRTSSSSLAHPAPRRLAGRWEAPSHAEGFAFHYLMDLPRLCPGLFTDPHYFQSPSLVKSNLVTYYRSGKTTLGSSSTQEGAQVLSNLCPLLLLPLCGLRSLWTQPLIEHAAGRSQPQLAAFGKGQEF